MAARSIVVRWGTGEDERKVAELLDLNGVPRWAAFEARFLVAEEDGEVLAAVQYRAAPGRLCLGLLVTDPWAGERALAVALYSGARDLARGVGIGQVRVAPDHRREHLLDAGYRRRLGGWRADTGWVGRTAADLPQGGWRRVLALLGEPAVPFFRPFVGGDLSERGRAGEPRGGMGGRDA